MGGRCNRAAASPCAVPWLLLALLSSCVPQGAATTGCEHDRKAIERTCGFRPRWSTLGIVPKIALTLVVDVYALSDRQHEVFTNAW